MEQELQEQQSRDREIRAVGAEQTLTNFDCILKLLTQGYNSWGKVNGKLSLQGWEVEKRGDTPPAILKYKL